jgi:hypothetical protein
MLKVVVLSVQFKKTLALKNYVNAAEVEGGQIDAIGIAGTVLHRAGDSDHLLNPGVNRTRSHRTQPANPRRTHRTLKHGNRYRRSVPRNGPQKFVLPPTAKHRGHIHSVPGAVVKEIS